MTSQPVEANVVLNADTSGYDSSINQSAVNTDQLGKSIDTLTGKMDRLSKSAGHKLLGISATDVAGITAATASYAAFEKQMTSLSAQSAILNKSMDAQKATTAGYVQSVNNLRGTFGTSTQDAAQLVQVLSKVGDNTSSVDKMATSFTKLGSAVQESPVALAQGMTQLSKSMGTPQRDLDKYNNQLAVLTANSNASAQGIIAFAQQLAPVGRMVGMSQTDIMGVSTAFQKAGQDGFQAATGFTKMMSDIAQASQSGSPDLAKYANLVGMTVGQFKELGGTDKYLKIFDALNRQGPQAITTLNRLGLDGLRIQRSVTALAQQGGPGKEINMARFADPDAMNRGSAAANTGIIDSLTRMRSELAMTGEAFGSRFAEPAKKFLDSIEKIMGVVRALVQGPLGDLAAAVAGIAAPFTAMGGAVLIAAKAMGLFSTAALALRGSGAFGFMEGRKGFDTVTAGQKGGNMGPAGKRMAADGSWVQRPLYNTGIRAGHGVQAIRDELSDRFPKQFPGSQPSGFQQGLYRATGGRYGQKRNPGLLSQGLGYGMSGIGWAANNIVGQQYSPLWGAPLEGLTDGPMGRNGIDDPTQRQRLFNRQRLGDYAPVRRMRNWWDRYSAPETGGPTTPTTGKHAASAAGVAGFLATLIGNGPSQAQPTTGGAPAAPKHREGSYEASKDAINDAATAYNTQQNPLSTFTDSLNKAARASGDHTKATMDATVGLKDMAGGIGQMMSSMLSAGFGVGKMGLRAGGKMLGTAAMDLLGGPVGIGMAAITAGAFAVSKYKDQGKYQYDDYSGFANPYQQAGGITAVGKFTPQTVANQQATTISGARKVTAADRLAANDQRYKLTNTQLKGLTKEQAMTALSTTYPTIQDSPQAMQALQLDLISQYGVGDATKMMGNLDSGKGFDPGSYVSKAMHQPGKSWYNFGMEDKGKVSKAFSQLGGVYSDQVDYTNQTQGPAAAMELQTKQMGQVIGMFQRQAEGGHANPYTEVTGHDTSKESDPNKTERTAFGQWFSKQFLGLTDVSEKQAESFRFDDNAKTDNDKLRGFFAKNWGKLNGDQQDNLLSGHGLSPSLTGTTAVNALLANMTGQNIAIGGPSLSDRINSVKGVQDAVDPTRSTFDSTSASYALEHTDDVNAQLVAVKDMFHSLTAAGKSAPEITKIMGDVRATAQTASDPNYALAAGVQEYAQRQMSYQMAGADRVTQFKGQGDLFKAAMAVKPGDEKQQQIQDQAADTFFQQSEGQRQYFVQLLTQQREFDISKKRSDADFKVQQDRGAYQFNLSRTRAEEDYGIQKNRMEYQYNLSRDRAQEDYHQQQIYSEEDYNRSRFRAQESYDIQRKRAVENFARSQKYAQFDFNLSRQRQEEDYQHSVQLMTEQTAKSASDIYKRIDTQRTSSGSWLLFNANQQLQQMQGQTQNLNKLRDMGMNDKTIQQLGLTDPNNAQQLARLVSDVAQDPKMIAEFNSAVSKRLKAAKNIAQDPSSQAWQEFVRQHRLQVDRAQSDFQRSTGRSRTQFKIQLAQGDADFRRSMTQQATDFGIQMERQNAQFKLSMTRAATDFHKTEVDMGDDFERSMKRAKQDYSTATDQMASDYHKTINRAAADLERSTKTIDGNFEDILSQSVKKLGGHARTQAAAVLKEFKDLKTSTSPVAIDIMQMLSGIFGVKYNAPAAVDSRGQTRSPTGGHSAPDRAAAEGGVLPGYTPGKDVHHFTSPTAGKLHLSGGEAIMRPEWTRAVGGEKAVEAMNRAAKNGAMQGARFASGGVFRPTAGGPIVQGIHDVSTGFPAVDIGVSQGTPVHAGASGTVTISRDLKGYEPRNSRQNGYYSYGRYIQIHHQGGDTLYAHLVRRLAGIGTHVRGGEVIGYSGHTGNVRGRTGDHLHFGVRGRPSIYDYLAGSTNYAGSGTAPGTVGGGGILGAMLDTNKGQNLASILSAAYPKVEKAVAALDAIKPLKAGQMSMIVNRFARQAYQQFSDKYGPPMGDLGVQVPHAPQNVHGNQALVKALAAKRGWVGHEWDSLYRLVTGESGFRNNAQNPSSSAYGMFQFLDSTWRGVGGHKTSDPRMQAIYGLRYIKSRYGDPINAYSKWNARHPHWYGDGAIFANGAQNIGVGDRGPEMVLPLNERGADFLQNLMQKMSAGNDAKSLNTYGHVQPASVHNQHNYQIDRSTTFSGPITVQANNPAELLNQLRARARTAALANPAKGGVKIS